MGRTSNCPLCKKEQNISFPEQAVYYYLQILFPDAKNRLKIEGWEVDIFLPTLNLAIEYDGYYYHKGLISTETEEKKEQAMREARIEILRIKEHTQKQPTPAVDNVLWQLVPKNYKKYLFVEDLMKRLIAWLNERYHLCLVTRPDIQRDSQNIMSGYISRRKENNLTQKAPELVNEWHPTRNGTITPDMVSVTANKKYWWMCSKGHKWQSSVHNRMRGNNCPYCSGKRVSRETSLAAQNRDLAKFWPPTKNRELTPWHVTPGSGKEVWWQCKKGHEWQMSVSEEVGEIVVRIARTIVSVRKMPCLSFGLPWLLNGTMTKILQNGIPIPYLIPPPKKCGGNAKRAMSGRRRSATAPIWD